MRFRTKSVFLALALTLSGVIVYKTVDALWRQKINEFKESPIKLLDSLPESALEVKDFHRTQVKDGRKLWEVSGEEVRYLKTEKEVVIKRPKLVFYRQNGESLEVTGNQGRIFFSGEEMERVHLEGAMEVNYSGFILKAHELLYVKGKDMIVLPGRVTLTGKGMELEGVGMEISLHEEKLRLQRQVRTKLEPDSIEKRETQKAHERKTAIL